MAEGVSSPSQPAVETRPCPRLLCKTGKIRIDWSQADKTTLPPQLGSGQVHQLVAQVICPECKSALWIYKPVKVAHS